jgi:hypothetical protein
MASDFAEYCQHVRQLQTKIARFAIWINLPAALLNFVLAQLSDLGLLPIHSILTPISWTLSLLWFVVSAVPLMLLAEFWEMWWNPFARDAYASQSSKMSDDARQSLLKGNRRVVQRAFGIAV